MGGEQDGRYRLRRHRGPGRARYPKGKNNDPQPVEHDIGAEGRDHDKHRFARKTVVPHRAEHRHRDDLRRGGYYQYPRVKARHPGDLGRDVVKGQQIFRQRRQQKARQRRGRDHQKDHRAKYALRKRLPPASHADGDEGPAADADTGADRRHNDREGKREPDRREAVLPHPPADEVSVHDRVYTAQELRTQRRQHKHKKELRQLPVISSMEHN